MKRVIKVLVVALLMAAILVAGISPAMAAKVRGGVPLPLTQSCDQIRDHAQGAAGEHVVLNPEGRAPGCWVLLPPSAS